MTIGVLGGMGPEATAAFFSLLVDEDRCESDQEHLRIVVDSDPSIPDRTAFLAGRGPDPLPAMVLAARRLEQAGAGIAGMPCMTAHAFLPRLRQAVALPFLSAFEVLAKAIDDMVPGAVRVGVLATTGSRKAGLFERGLPGRTMLWPSEDEQEELVMQAIYGPEGIKAGNRGDVPRGMLARAGESLAKAGAEVILAGCTEIPLALRREDVGTPLLDPMACLARALVAHARGRFPR